ncbi:MAG: ammonia-forming cytochrome c nitrite reductase subunit c552 [Thermoplasmata archaeon]
MIKRNLFLSILFVAFLVFLLVILFQPPAYADEVGTRAGEKYVGSDECQSCHPLSYDGWNSTRHPRAWDTLNNSGSKIEACEVCHVTGYGLTGQDGFDRVTDLPVAMQGTQCEACHGPGEDHIVGPDTNPLEVSLSALVCGATCHQEEHHPYYEEWNQSGHAISLVALKGAAGAAEDSCLACHSVDYFFDDTTTLDTAEYSITCSRCHDPHTSDYPNQLRMPADELCAECHNPSGALPGDPISHPQSSMREGRSGAPILGESFMPDVVCADCHVYMNKQTNVTGHSFTPKVEACVECHTSTPPIYSNDTAQVQITEWKTQTWTKVIDVQALVVLAGKAIDDAPEYGFSESTIDLARELHEQANYSLTFVVADGSGGSHNPVFAQQLLGFAENKSNEIIGLLTPGMVVGRVIDESGNPVEGVVVVIDGMTMATTESNGTFSFSFAPGTHSFNLKLKGDLVGSVDMVTVQSQQTTDIGDVTITEESLFIPLMMAVLVILLLVALVIFMFYRMQKITPKKSKEEIPEPEEEEET